MENRPTERIAVILRRETVESRWEDHRWSVLGVVPDVGGPVRAVRDDGVERDVLHPAFELVLFADEAEGYYLNVSSGEPSVFVSVRMDDASGDAYPFQATLSYNEAARWMDGGERVERVPAWPELSAWMGRFVEAHYRPEPRRRQRPRSFEGKEGRLREEGNK